MLFRLHGLLFRFLEILFRLHELLFRFMEMVWTVCTDYSFVSRDLFPFARIICPFFFRDFLSEHVQIVCPFLMHIIIDKFKTLLVYKI